MPQSPSLLRFGARPTTPTPSEVAANQSTTPRNSALHLSFDDEAVSPSLAPLSILHIEPGALNSYGEGGDRFIASVLTSAFDEEIRSPTVATSEGGPGSFVNEAAHNYRATLRDSMGIRRSVMQYERHGGAALEHTATIPASRVAVTPPPATSGVRSALWDSTYESPGSYTETTPGDDTGSAEGGGGYSTPRKSLMPAPPGMVNASSPLSVPYFPETRSPPLTPQSRVSLAVTPRVTPRHTQGLSPPATPPPPDRSSTQFRTPVMESGVSPSAGSTTRTGMQSPSPFQSLMGTPSSKIKRHRKPSESCSPSRILNAGGLASECGTSVLSWQQANHLFLALGDVVYAWTPTKNQVVFRTPDTFVTAVSAYRKGSVTHVGIGCDNGLVHVLILVADLSGKEMLVTAGHYILSEHMSRVCGADISSEEKLVTASADGVIVITDLRSPPRAPIRVVVSSGVYVAKFSHHGSHFAVGTDEGLTIFRMGDLGSPTVRATPYPVKNVCWSPHGHLSVLAYSIGSSVHFFSPGAGDKGHKELKDPVVSLSWSANSNELVVGFGVTPEGAEETPCGLNIFDTSDILVNEGHVKLSHTVTGHRSPPFQLELSPDGSTVVSGAGGSDGTLRFWSLFPSDDEVCPAAHLYQVHSPLVMMGGGGPPGMTGPGLSAAYPMPTDPLGQYTVMDDTTDLR